MKRNPVIPLVLVALAVAAATKGDCKPPGPRIPIQSGVRYNLDLSTVMNKATDIRIEESLSSNFKTILKTTTWHQGDTVPVFSHITSDDRFLYYRVTAWNANDQSFGCSYTDQIAVSPDPVTRKNFRKVIIPVVGSLAGANGSHFQTSITLVNPFDPGTATLTGRIVFHPAQLSGGDGDPSIAYSLAPGQHVSYDDIVASIGASGLGSIDMVPDGDLPTVPAAHTTIYNDAGNGATFGMSVPQIRAEDFDSNYTFATNGSSPVLNLVVPARTQKRINVGVRSGATGGSIEVIVRHSDGSGSDVRRDYPADYFVQSGIDDFAGAAVADGDLVRVFMTNVIVYASETNNMTNDPEMQTPFANTANLDVGYFF